MKALSIITLTESQCMEIEPVLQALAEADEGASTLAQLYTDEDGALALRVGVIDNAQVLAVQAIVAPDKIGEKLVPILVPRFDTARRFAIM